MKAITYDRFGGVDVLRLSDVETPTAAKNGLLVRVRAVSINPVDGKLRRGELKLMSGTHFPKRTCGDFSGVVEAVGAGTTGFAIGDAVYGSTASIKAGALGELVAVPATTVAKKPASLDFVAAASVPVVAQAALQALRDVAGCRAGAHVLVNGCTGGVGLYALQLAKRMGAHVTGVCSAEGLAIARSFGADVVFDYRKEAITSSGLKFDVLLELSARLPFADADVLLGEHGVYVDFVPSPAALVGNTLANPFRAHKHKFVMTSTHAKDLEELARLFDGGELRAAPAREFDFADFQQAFTIAESGSVIGKVVVRID